MSDEGYIFYYSDHHLEVSNIENFLDVNSEMRDIDTLHELYGIENIINPEDLYIIIADDFSYETASRDDVIFYDHVAEYEHGWERYDLDSLAADELSQLPYEPGFGSIKIPDDNGSSTYTILNDFRGADLESDWEIDNFDDDPNWDYVWDFYDETTDNWVSYFTNDIDGIDSVPFLQEGLDQGMYLSNSYRFEDLDGDVDYFDINDTEDYYKSILIQPGITLFIIGKKMHR